MTKRKTLRIDMCARCRYSKTLTTSDQESLSECSVAVQMQGGCVMCDRCIHSKTLARSYKESLSESSVAVQMQGDCVSAYAAVIATFQAPAVCHRAIATVHLFIVPQDLHAL